MRFQTAETAFDVPEFFKTDVCSKAGLCNMIVEQLQSDTIGYDGGLAYCDVGKRPGMHKAGVVFCRAHQSRVNGITHEGCHCVTHFQITCSNRFAALVKGD